VLVFNVVVPAGGLQARKKLERALLEWLDGPLRPLNRSISR
jgi:hypothetical protein